MYVADAEEKEECTNGGGKGISTYRKSVFQPFRDAKGTGQKSQRRDYKDANPNKGGPESSAEKEMVKERTKTTAPTNKVSKAKEVKQTRSPKEGERWKVIRKAKNGHRKKTNRT